VLVPLILFFSLIGVYLVSFNTFDIYMMVAFAALAIALRLFGFPMAPLILAFILGDLMEDNLRRALALSDGSIAFLWDRWLTLGILGVTVALVFVPMITGFLRARRAAEQAGEGG
jgi:putative tricarboxylic transport membrane protein